MKGQASPDDMKTPLIKNTHVVVETFSDEPELEGLHLRQIIGWFWIKLQTTYSKYSWTSSRTLVYGAKSFSPTLQRADALYTTI